jgi:CBS domain-containing protein
MTRMNVGQSCTRSVVVAGKDTPLFEIARLMREHHVGDVVIVEERGDGRIPVGIVTDRDIVVGVLAKDGEHVTALVARDVLTRDVRVVPEGASVLDVLKRMKAHGVRRVPVGTVGMCRPLRRASSSSGGSVHLKYAERHIRNSSQSRSASSVLHG